MYLAATTNRTGMADLAETILSLLADREGFNTLTLAQELGTDHQKVVGAIKSIQSQGDVSINSLSLDMCSLLFLSSDVMMAGLVGLCLQKTKQYV